MINYQVMYKSDLTHKGYSLINVWSLHIKQKINSFEIILIYEIGPLE